SSHKCTGLHGVSASRATLDRLVPMIAAEMDRWQVADPRSPDATDKTLGPLMVHKAQTALDVVAEARKAGLRIVREGGRAGGDYALEWEEFGASTVGESGNMGVGEVQATISIYSRRQKGRHFVF